MIQFFFLTDACYICSAYYSCHANIVSNLLDLKLSAVMTYFCVMSDCCKDVAGMIYSGCVHVCMCMYVMCNCMEVACHMET